MPSWVKYILIGGGCFIGGGFILPWLYLFYDYLRHGSRM